MKHYQRNKACGFWQGMLFIAILGMFLLGTCRNPFSIADFIKENTSEAKVKSWDLKNLKITVGDSDGSNRVDFMETTNNITGRTLVFYIDPAQQSVVTPSRSITIEFPIDNPQGYSLNMIPDYRVYKFDSMTQNDVQIDEENDDRHHLRKVTVEQKDAATGLLSIENAVIGERYDIKLNVSMSDGTRVFDTADIPAIVFNSPLNSPRNLNLYAFKHGGEWYPFAQWDINQIESVHPGINKITLSFQEERDNAVERRGTYVYSIKRMDAVTGNPIWEYNIADSENTMGTDAIIDEVLTKVGSDSASYQFRVRFPVKIYDDRDIETKYRDNSSGLLYELNDSPAFNTYNFTVTVQDRYGLTTRAGFDNGQKALNTTILKGLTIRNSSNNEPIKKGFYSPGFVNYSIGVGYDVSEVVIGFELSDEFPDQYIEFADDGRKFDTNGEIRRKLTSGAPLHINFNVKNGATDNTPYVLTITRDRPESDSYLADVYAEADSVKYKTTPLFTLSPGNSERVYYIYVPSTIDAIYLNADLPLMSPDDNGYAPGKKIPSIVTVTNGGEQHTNIHDPTGKIKGKDGRWLLSIPGTSNLFKINVQPEAGNLRVYTVIISKYPDDDDADLSALTVTASPDNTVFLNPSDDELHKIESYTANVSNKYNSVVIAATVRNPRASVTNIRTTGTGSITTLPESGNTYSARLSNLSVGDSCPVTITVRHPEGASHRDYNVTVNRMLPAVEWINPLELNRSVELSWKPVSGVQSTSSYELYYHTENIDNVDDIIGTATKWGGSATVSGNTASAVVTGLTNAREYHFWVRAVGGNVHGEWSQPVTAMPKSDNNYLANIVVSGGIPIEPIVFDPVTNSYSIAVPSAAGSIAIEGKPVEQAQIVSYNYANGNVALEPGETKEVRITVKSHSGKDNIYTVTVHRMLPGPKWSENRPLGEPGKITLDWSPLSGGTGTISYEVYYHTDGTAPPPPPSELPVGTDQDFPRCEKASTPHMEISAGVTNGQQYYFWVRGVIGNFPGEWSAVGLAMPKSNIAHLDGITVNGTPVPGFASGVYSYSVTVPSGTGNVTVIIANGNGDTHQQIYYTRQGGTDGMPLTQQTGYGIALNNGASSILTIAVHSQDGKNSNTYTLTVNQRPVTPGALTFTPNNGYVLLNWASVAEASGGYDLYYSSDTTVSLPDGTTGFPQAAKPWNGNNASVSGTAVTIGGLETNRTYYFYLRAKAVGLSGTVYSEWRETPYTISTQSTGLTVAFIQPADIGEAITAGETISLTSNTPINIVFSPSVGSNYTYRWYNGVTLVQSGGSTLTIIPGNSFNVGRNTVTLRITDSASGIVYSKSATFDVVR